MALPTPLSNLIKSCEKLCVKECCGIEAFDFSPVHIASWLHQSRGEPTEKTIRQVKEQLEDLKAQHGTASSSEGYESGEGEMNQIFAPAQVDQLATQLLTNLDHAITLKEQSNIVEWKPEGAPTTTEHHPQWGNQFVRALSWRYACKKFDPTQHVSAEDIDTILSAINLSASSYGLQPYQFVVVQDRKLQEKLMPVSYNQTQVRDASAVIVFAIRTDIDEKYIKDSATLTEQIRSLDPGTLDDYAGQMIGHIMGLDDDQRALWATKQTYIAMGTGLAACAMLGVDSCPMEGFIADEYDQILGLGEKELHATVVLPIGYRSSDDEQSDFAKVRMSLDEMVVKIS